MARTKLTPKKREGELGASNQEGKGGEGCTGKEVPLSSTSPIPSKEALTRERGGEEAGRGREVG